MLNQLSAHGVRAEIKQSIHADTGIPSMNRTVCYSELTIHGRSVWGVGMAPTNSVASIKAVLSALHRAGMLADLGTIASSEAS
jgi:2-isopropylmalate synthase